MHGKNPQISNTGYFVKPGGEKPQDKYLVYPKITTFSKGNFTAYDANVLNSNSRTKKAKEKWRERSGKIKSFTMLKIEGHKVEMRICSDIRKDLVIPQPAHTQRRKADLMIVPSQFLSIDPQKFKHLRRRFYPDGMMVTVDHVSLNALIMKFPPKKQHDQKGFPNPIVDALTNRSRTHGRIKITHKL
jgi:hypothetical protein